MIDSCFYALCIDAVIFRPHVTYIRIINAIAYKEGGLLDNYCCLLIILERRFMLTLDSIINDLTLSVKDALYRYADFDGRSSRRDFWYYCLFQLIVVLAFELLTTIISWSIILVILAHGAYFILELGLLIPSIAVSIRRLHDIGRPGRDYLWGFIPIVGGIILLRWFCQESQPGTNQYGPDPYALNRY